MGSSVPGFPAGVTFNPLYLYYREIFNFVSRFEIDFSGPLRD